MKRILISTTDHAKNILLRNKIFKENIFNKEKKSTQYKVSLK